MGFDIVISDLKEYGSSIEPDERVNYLKRRNEMKTILLIVMMLLIFGCNEDHDYSKKCYACPETVQAQSVPEPGTFILLGSGLIALAGIRRRWINDRLE